MSNIKNNKKNLSPEQREELLRTLKARFEKNMNRHKDLQWAKVQAKLDSRAGEEKLWSLNEMERTGGEPDVVGHDKKTGEYIFYDCSAFNGRKISGAAGTWRVRHENVELGENTS